jgi:3-hydroxyisobutyrate dehydrogenase-like beta-hydroxyacid dehydrogenase
MNVGFIGLGQMGAGIAANLVRAAYRVTVWNRSPAKTRALLEAGAAVGASPRELAATSEVVFSMLADDAALLDVLEGDSGLLEGLAPGAIHVSLSTIGVAAADTVALMHAERGQRFVSAPVFGRPAAAAAAKLFILAAGAAADLQRVQDLFAVIGQRVFVIGEKPSSANLVKLCGNFMILAAIESLGEALALADRGGIAKSQLVEVLTSTLFDAPVYKNYGAILVGEKFRPAGFAAPLGLKDMRLAREAADGLGLTMPVLAVLDAHLREVIARDGPDVDWSSIGRLTGLEDRQRT